MLLNIGNRAKQKPVIFIDFFDTLMFRQVHSHSLMRPWEKALKKKYPVLEGIDLCALRRAVIAGSGRDESEIPYHALLREIYGRFPSEVRASFSCDGFEKASCTIDCSLDLATQYPNAAMVRMLKKLKSSGRKIFLVTDFYLPGRCCLGFLRPYGLQELFDGIFCSSDIGKSKVNGTLYPEVLSLLGISSSDVLMIGDSRSSDVENAEKAGIAAVRYFPFLHKIRTNLRKKTGYDYRKNVCRCMFGNCFRNTLFGEYALNLYYFTGKLYCELTSSGFRTAYFLARGGYFLQNCFDSYLALLPDAENIGSVYLKNSRKVNRLAAENETDRELLCAYLAGKLDSKTVCFVDEGWYCTSQIIIEKLTGYKIHGYYLGIMGKNPEDRQYSRKGLLFDIDEQGNRSPLYGVFRTNCTFYEQLLSAPHGSTKRYCRQGGQTDVLEDWQETEKQNYFENIAPLQNVISDLCLGLQVWDASPSLYELAGYVLKTQLFGSEERLRLLEAVGDAWYDNANDTKEKKNSDVKSVRIRPLELLLRPENYLRYFCRIKELKLTRPVMRLIYPVLGPLIYLYCRISLLKYRKIKEVSLPETD